MSKTKLTSKLRCRSISASPKFRFVENEILRCQLRFGYAEARLLFYRRVLLFMTTPLLYDYQQQLKVLKLKESFNVKRFPWLRSKTLEAFEIKVTSSTNSLDGLGESLTKCPALKKLSLVLSRSQVNNLEPLAKLTSLSQLSLVLTNTQVNNLEPLLKLNFQTLELTLTTAQRLSLKTIPTSVTSLSF